MGKSNYQIADHLHRLLEDAMAEVTKLYINDCITPKAFNDARERVTDMITLARAVKYQETAIKLYK